MEGSLGPVSWRRSDDVDGQSREVRIEVEVYPDGEGARIEWRAADQAGTARLADDPAERPAVLLFDESVELLSRELEALRVPDGTADVIADAVAYFQSG